MSANARAILPMLWLLASEDDDPVSGLVQSSYEKISFRLRQPLKEIKAAVEEILQADFIELIQPCNEYVSKPYPNRNLGVTPYREETDREYREETYNKETDAREDFEKFWELYPKQRRGGKENAYRAYLKALTKTTKEIVYDGVQAYCHSDEVARGFAKGAAAWLNDERWSSDYHTVPVATLSNSARNLEKSLTALHRAGTGNGHGERVQPATGGGDIFEGQIITEPAGGGEGKVIIPAFLRPARTD